MPKLLHFQPGGIGEYWMPEGVKTVYASTCSHCQHITEGINLKDIYDKTDRCRGCMRLICKTCGGKPCWPWEKECEYQEREQLKAKVAREAWGCY